MLINSAKTLLPICLAIVPHWGKSGTIISGTDKKVHKTTIAVDNSRKNIIIFWTTESLKNFKGRVNLAFNRSENGGNTWLKQPVPFAGNAKSGWVNDFLPALCFDKSNKLHAVWLQADNRTAPRYSMTEDYGKKWTSPVIIGKAKAIWRGGVSLGIDYSPDSMALNPFNKENTDELEQDPSKKIWSMYDEHRLYGVMAESAKVKWYNIPVKVSRTRNLPGKVKYALQHGASRYILRVQRKTGICLMKYKNRKWSTRLIFQAKKPLNLAESHSFAINSKGAIFIVFSDQGKLNCLYVRDFGSKMDKLTLPVIKGSVKSPVIGVSAKNEIYIAFQMEKFNEKNGKNISLIAYTKSSDLGKSWSKFKKLSNSGTSQVAPDMVIADNRMLISYTDDNRAAFMVVPDSE